MQNDSNDQNLGEGNGLQSELPRGQDTLLESMTKEELEAQEQYIISQMQNDAQEQQSEQQDEESQVPVTEQQDIEHKIGEHSLENANDSRTLDQDHLVMDQSVEQKHEQEPIQEEQDEESSPVKENDEPNDENKEAGEDFEDGYYGEEEEEQKEGEGEGDGENNQEGEVEVKEEQNDEGEDQDRQDEQEEEKQVEAEEQDKQANNDEEEGKKEEMQDQEQEEVKQGEDEEQIDIKEDGQNELEDAVEEEEKDDGQVYESNQEQQDVEQEKQNNENEQEEEPHEDEEDQEGKAPSIQEQENDPDNEPEHIIEEEGGNEQDKSQVFEIEKENVTDHEEEQEQQEEQFQSKQSSKRGHVSISQKDIEMEKQSEGKGLDQDQFGSLENQVNEEQEKKSEEEYEENYEPDEEQKMHTNSDLNKQQPEPENDENYDQNEFENEEQKSEQQQLSHHSVVKSIKSLRSQKENISKQDKQSIHNSIHESMNSHRASIRSQAVAQALSKQQSNKISSRNSQNASKTFSRKSSRYLSKQASQKNQQNEAEEYNPDKKDSFKDILQSEKEEPVDGFNYSVHESDKHQKPTESFSQKDNFEARFNDITTYAQTPIDGKSPGQEITKADLDTFQHIFQIFDKTGSGEIVLQDLLIILQGLNLTQYQAREVVQKNIQDQNDPIKYEKYLAIMMKIQKRQAQAETQRDDKSPLSNKIFSLQERQKYGGILPRTGVHWLPDQRITDILKYGFIFICSVLQEYRKNCSKDVKTIEARRVQQKLEDIKMKETMKHMENIKQSQQKELSSIEQRQHVQAQELEDAWNRFVKKYEEGVAAQVKQLKEKHNEEKELIIQRVKSDFYEKNKGNKPSKDILLMKRQVKVLCQLKQFAEAEKVQVQLDKKEKEEAKKLEMYIQAAIDKELEKLKAKHLAQMNVLMTRVQRDRNEQRKHKQSDLQYVHLRNKNEVQDTVQRQNAEMRKNSQFLKYVLGKGSPESHKKQAFINPPRFKTPIRNFEHSDRQTVMNQENAQSGEKNEVRGFDRSIVVSSQSNTRSKSQLGANQGTKTPRIQTRTQEEFFKKNNNENKTFVNEGLGSMTSRNHIQTSLSGAMGVYGQKNIKFLGGAKSTKTLYVQSKKGALKLPQISQK